MGSVYLLYCKLLHCPLATYLGNSGSPKNLMVSMKKNLLLCESVIGKFIPQHHHLSSLGKLRDTKCQYLAQILLSHSHTNHRFL